jgi:hypothetical protein
VKPPPPFSPSRMMLARNGLEDLATRCLRDAVTAALILSGNEPEKASWELAAAISVRMAVVIRRDVAKRLEELLASEGAEEFLRTLAMDQGRDMLEEGGAPR